MELKFYIRVQEEFVNKKTYMDKWAI